MLLYFLKKDKLLMVINFVINFYGFFPGYNEVFVFIRGFGFSLGEILTFFVGQIYKYKKICIKEKKIPMKQYIKDYSFLFIIILCFRLIGLSQFYFIKSSGSNEEEEVDKYKHIVTFDALESIFVTIVTYLLLKYTYYIHHIISIIALVILAVIIDLLLSNFKNNYIPYIIISLFNILIDSIYFSYVKYLIEKKYYYFMDILFIIGIFDFIIFILSFFIILLVQKINSTYKLIFQFYEFYKYYGTGKIVFLFLISLILKGLILFTFEMKILEMFGPNFVYLCFLISEMPSSIILTKGYKRWIILVLSLFQILFCLFYIEILEYNFCSLNKNTKKSIAEREHKQSIRGINDDDNDDEIDIKGYDLKESIKMQEKIKELNEINEINDD